MSYRSRYIEQDFSGFVLPSIQENGGMVVVSPKGRGDKAILCESEADVITNFGTPSSTYPSLFEAVAYCREAPCYIASAIGDDALYGGVIVSDSAITSLTSGVSSVDNYTFPSNDYAFGLFPASQYESALRANIITQTGTKFKATLYNRVSGKDIYIKEYNFSLTKEKDAFGKSLYYDDVFNDDPYLIPVYNDDTTSSTFTAISGTSTYQFTGGDRGDTPSDAQITTAYALFNSVNKYPVNIIMDVLGGHSGDLNTYITTYNEYAHGITPVPLGYTVAQMVTYRSDTGLDTDNISLYSNWIKITDPYNDSFAWINNVGGIGAKYAKMKDVYDGLSPAGIDENNHGGQIQTWRPVEAELYFSDTNLQTLDEAQINPFVHDEIYGVYAAGDKTLQSSLSDTSYIGTRRLYNLISKTIRQQILRKQEFKNNDAAHRYKAKSLCDDFLAPIVSQQLFNEILVVCDDTNNTATVLEQRNFYIDIYVKVTTNSQFVTLRLNRLSQTQSVSEFLS